ncbi:NADH oxidase [Thermoplasma volcanium GSS1]|uniref:NADH oxidase n=1 Tax=Thermoplasma volcanium (strain ATCC 51530 / DSM 4299 / JCM 9571 / NBRC 15438 / GSS1) TaxID=273116 RepID=Q97C71_THEVO|nr:FAD-dependent oxidoreductase [Thermoplasma volcanium]BAB59375.1 NADH oxidase [Thermoplasma volcanium GSS1]
MVNPGDKGRIGNVEIKNRIVMAPMISNIANSDGSPSEPYISYMRERARGGIGLIITEYTYVDPESGKGSRNQLGIYDDIFLPKFSRLAEAVHDYGSKIFVQLVHAGAKALPSSSYKIAPSKTSFDKNAREMDSSDIERVIRNYERAASIARRAGFDGIEIHGAHGYLVDEFISPYWNRRTDKYGGSLEGRIKFPQEVIDAVKSEVDIPVGIRLSLYEDEVGGYGPDYGIKVAKSLVNIDYVHFSAGNNDPPGSSAPFYSNHTHILSKFPGGSNKPTILVGSVTTAEDVRNVLKVADFVAVGRAVLADPYFARKVIDNYGHIRPCIRCNQACRNLAYGEVRCTVNPYFAFPRQLRKLSGDVVIVGGGVKGLEAARFAALNGLSVTLYEQDDKIGGQLNTIYDEAKRKEFNRLIEYYKEVLDRLGVEIITSEKYKGKGIYCLPDKTYPDLQEKPEIFIDSNVYMYHDIALKYSSTSKVFVTYRSLSSLDRARKAAFLKIAESRGIKFIEKADNYDVSIYEEKQYDIGEAMKSGINEVEKYIDDRINEFL